MTLTKWFHPYVKPVHVGWYHTGATDKNPEGIGFESHYNWWWDGKKWLSSAYGFKASEQNRWWRGVVK